MPESAPRPFGQQPQGLVGGPAQQPYLSALYGLPSSQPILVNQAAFTAGSGTTTQYNTGTFNRGAPMYGDVLVVCIGADHDYGSFGISEPTAPPLGGGVTEWARLGLRQSGGGSQYMHMMYFGRVDTTRSSQIQLPWTGPGGGIVAVFRGLRGILRDWGQFGPGGGTGSATMGGPGWGDFGGIVVGGMTVISPIAQNPAVSTGPPLKVLVSQSAGVTRDMTLSWARYSGGTVTVSAASASGVVGSGGIII